MDEVVRLMPQNDYIFYGDSKNNPYGEKSDEELMSITSDITEQLIAKGCRIIVIACNTATTRCRKALMKKYPDIVFFGTVPAVKVACDRNFKNILVLATPATIASQRMKELIEANKKADQNIYPVACFGLADAIENDDNDEIDRILNDIQKEYQNHSIDAVVLGCTHYPFIKERIAEKFPDAEIIDGAKGVARETQHQIKLLGEDESSDKHGTIEITFTQK